MYLMGKYFFFFKENKAWHFRWSVYLSDDSHEMSSRFLSENFEEKKIRMSSAAVYDWHFNFYHSLGRFSRWLIDEIFLQPHPPPTPAPQAPPQKIGSDISHKSKETICMKYQNHFLGNIRTRGPWWPCNAHLSIIALREPDLELIKANILTKIHNDYIYK